MIHNTIRIATRKSPLALWQAEQVATFLQQQHPHLTIQFIKMTTTGDRFLAKPLSKIGGKRVFLKELEEALLANEADLAVHSMKDVPAELPPGLQLSSILARGEPRDALVCPEVTDLMSLADGAIIGTASLRRGSQLLALRPDLQIRPVRGNVQTRLQQLEEKRYDALVLAAAGLVRLGLDNHIACYVDPLQCLPAVGQGAIGIECRQTDDALQDLLVPLHDKATASCLEAERRMNKLLGGNCRVPIAGYAVIKDQRLHLNGLVASPDGRRVLRATGTALISDAASLGETVAQDLLSQGAKAIIAACQDE